MVNLEMNRWRVINVLFLCFESVKSYWGFCVMYLYTIFLLFIIMIPTHDYFADWVLLKGFLFLLAP